jgi:hypothetical protein
MKKCNGCIATVGPISKFYCDYHAGMSAANMAAKRADDPVYRELERFAVKKRMRQIRLKRVPAGITGNVRSDNQKPRADPCSLSTPLHWPAMQPAATCSASRPTASPIAWPQRRLSNSAQPVRGSDQRRQQWGVPNRAT